MKRHGHGFGPGEVNYALIDREARIGVDDFGPLLAKHNNGEEHGHLATGHDHDLIGINVNVAPFRDIGGYSLAALDDAVRRRIAVMAITAIRRRTASSSAARL